MKKVEIMKIVPFLIASAALFYSCDKKQSAVQETTDTSIQQNDSVKVDSTASTSTTVQPQTVPQTDGTAVAANTPDRKPSLNPEHGQPFHRCDIAVGAPIDSAPQSTTPQVLPAQPNAASGFNTSPIAPSVSSSATPMEISGPKPAMNPAHGEPYHRCDLQVGAPLT